jgi:hypothetical protein
MRDNIHQWLGDKSLHVYWDLTSIHLKEDDYITYVDARKVNSLEEWVDEIEDQRELLKGLCMNEWTNLPHNQNPYLFKILVKIWKLQLVYIDFFHFFPCH